MKTTHQSLKDIFFIHSQWISAVFFFHMTNLSNLIFLKFWESFFFFFHYFTHFPNFSSIILRRVIITARFVWTIYSLCYWYCYHNGFANPFYLFQVYNPYEKKKKGCFFLIEQYSKQKIVAKIQPSSVHTSTAWHNIPFPAWHNIPFPDTNNSNLYMVCYKV